MILKNIFNTEVKTINSPSVSLYPTYDPLTDYFFFSDNTGLNLYKVKNSDNIVLVNSNFSPYQGVLKFSSDGVLYSNDGTNLHVSNDYGISFATRPFPVTLQFLNLFKICPITNDLFVFSIVSQQLIIYRSTDQGVSWIAVYTSSLGTFAVGNINYFGVEYVYKLNGFFLTFTNSITGLPYKMIVTTSPTLSFGSIDTFVGAAVDQSGGGHGLIYASTANRFGILKTLVNNTNYWAVMMTTQNDVTKIVLLDNGYVINNQYNSPLGVTLANYNIGWWPDMTIDYTNGLYDENNNLIVTSNALNGNNRRVGRYRVWES